MYILIHRELAKRMEESMDFVRNRLSDAGVMQLLKITYNGRIMETDDRSLTIHFVCGSNTSTVIGIRPDYHVSDTGLFRYVLAERNSKPSCSLWQACDLVIDHLKENYPVKKDCLWYDGCYEGLKNCTDGCKDCRFYEKKNPFIDLNAITHTGTYQPKEAPKPKDKMYLTTHNPYMSEDWKKKFFDKFTEQYMDTDVNSMYPSFYVPARGSGKTAINITRMAEAGYMDTDLIKDYVAAVYGVPTEKLDKKLSDGVDAFVYGLRYLHGKEKEKENMNHLVNELHKTNGAAILEVSGNRYKAKVFDITMKSGEVTTLNVGVDDTPNNFLRTTREPVTRRALPAIEKVIFNDPATIVFWSDGTKTVVQARDEAFDPEKGLAMAISKKALGNQGRYFETFKKWLKEEN